MSAQTIRSCPPRHFNRTTLAASVALALAASPASAYTVTNNATSGAGSLAQAVLDSNANCAIDPAPVIGFSGPFTISVPTTLAFSCPSGPYSPTINGISGVVLDGTGSFVSDAITYSDVFGYGGDLTVRGLEIRDFTYGGAAAIAGRVQVYGNRIWNNSIGVFARDGSTIGSSAPADRNLIYSNLGSGIEISYGSQVNIVNNYVGTADGTSDSGNGGDGMDLPGLYDSVISGNVISGNTGNGITIQSGGNNLISGNAIGTNAAGTAALDNERGIYLEWGWFDVIDGNTISGNQAEGIYVYNATDVTISNNKIGTNAAGTGAIPNSTGIYAESSADLTVDSNVISGNSGHGIHYYGVDSYGGSPFISDNLIGVAANGTTALPNGGHGIFFSSTYSQEITGGIIAKNSGAGIRVESGTGNVIVAAGIHGNGGKNIDLDMYGGPVPNDAGDGDGGANNWQNFPVITSALQFGGTFTNVDFTLDSTPGTFFDIYAYCSSTGVKPGGETLMASTGFFAAAGPTAGSIGFSGTCAYVSLIAVNSSSGDTSEFSAMAAVVAAPTPAVTVSATTLNFGNVGVNSTSGTLTSTMTSTGTLAWDIYYIGSPSCYGGPICYGGAEFACSTTCTESFQALQAKSSFQQKAYSPGQSCSLSASFSPTVTGPQTATVQFCGNVAPITITLMGNGVIPPPLSLSNSIINFGTVPVGQSVGPIPIALNNPGTVAVGVSSVEVTGPFSASTTNCIPSVAPGGSCSVFLSFAPTAEGPAGGVMTVHFADGSSLSATLTGTGSVQPELLLPSEVAFVYTVGQAPTTQQVELRNTGIAPLEISSIAIAGEGFTLAHSCPASLAAGGACVLNLGFSALLPGEASGSLTVVSNAPGGPDVIALRGIAQPRAVPILEVLPVQIGFGSRALGSTSGPQVVKVRNIGGRAVVFDSFVTSADFVILGNGCPNALDSLQTCEVRLGMRPAGFGPRIGSFTIRSNAENGPNGVLLSGTGCHPGGIFFGRLGVSSGCGP